MNKQIPDLEKIKTSIPAEQAPEQKLSEAQRERARAIGKLHDSFETLFGASMGGTFAHSGEEGFSGDAASIYVLISLQNEKGEKSLELVKVGWGEFSKKTFEDDKYPVLKNFPFDIYCLSQNDSYFADEKLKKEMAENPEKYLSEHCLFAANNGQVYLAERVGYGTRHFGKKIIPVPFDEMLRVVRNQIIKIKSAPEEFAAFLRELPDDPVKLGRYMSDLEHRVPWLGRKELKTADEKKKTEARKKELMHILWDMGVERTGIAVGDAKAMGSVIALKKQFDFENNQFA
ncbi:hypothetical protein HZB94_02100 [Candidatus Falkowbacteria bacterium]|nr:hypothetical protein [Candidatus Falkowbacteria bacterium]